MARIMPFSKMSGAGNDFVVLDNRTGVLKGDLNHFAASVAERKRGVGADGVLLVEPSARKDFRMRFFNSDGSEGAMCGNGACCIARFANLIGVAGKTMQFETIAGDLEAVVRDDGQVELKTTVPHSMQLDMDLPVDGRMLQASFLDTGAPHVVVLVDNVEAVDVIGTGRKIRYHEAFSPDGTNANFVQVTGPKTLSVRTYERGVEDETLACGTGSVAAAILMARLGKVCSPVTVTTRGGDALAISFNLGAEIVTEVSLKGPAEVSFEGQLDLMRYAPAG